MFLVFTKDLFSKKSLLSEFGHPGSLRDIAAAVPEVILDQHGSHGGRRTERHPSPSASRLSDGEGDGDAGLHSVPSRRINQRQACEVAPQVASIDRSEADALSLGMRCNQEVRDEMLPRTAFLAVAQVNQSGQTRGIGVDVVVGDGKRTKHCQERGSRIGPRRKFGKNHRADTKFPLFGSQLQDSLPSLKASLFPPNRQNDRCVDSGSH